MSGHFYRSPYLVKSARLARQSVTRLIGTADSPLLGPNPRRRGLILCAPAAARDSWRNFTVSVFNTPTDVTGSRLMYTVPTNVEAQVIGSSAFIRSGAPLYGLLMGGATGAAFINQQTASVAYSQVINLAGGDNVQWFVNVAAPAGSTADFLFSIREQRAQDRYTVSFAGPALLDAGPTVYPGHDPVCVLQGEVAQSVTEEVRAVSAGGPQTVTVIELFDFLEEIPRGRHP